MEGVEGEAGQRAVHRIVPPAKSREISDYAARRALTLVRFLFDPATVYASIAADEGGVVLLWLAGDSSIEIDIASDGEYWWSVRDVAGETCSGHGGEIPVVDLGHSLNSLSREVERRNPEWREVRKR